LVGHCFLSLLTAAPPSLSASAAAGTARVSFQPHWDATIPLPNAHEGRYYHYLDNGLDEDLVEDDRELLTFPGVDPIPRRKNLPEDAG
jgi:hypothetical protein